MGQARGVTSGVRNDDSFYGMSSCRNELCGASLPPYSGRGRPQLYCDADCRYAAERARRSLDEPERPCGECGERFIPKRRDHRWCSEQCQRAASKRRERERGYKQPPKPPLTERQRDLRRARKHNRRARERAAGELPLLSEVAERDGWVCHLCQNTLGPVTRDNWSADHVLPLSLGGSNEASNVRLAHRTCNERKGADSRLTQITYCFE